MATDTISPTIWTSIRCLDPNDMRSVFGGPAWEWVPEHPQVFAYTRNTDSEELVVVCSSRMRLGCTTERNKEMANRGAAVCSAPELFWERHGNCPILIRLLERKCGGSGVKSFPKPLSAKEERELLEQMRAGGEAGKARNELIERNLRLVAHIVKKYSGTDKELDDLISIGTIGLIKAVDTYKADKGIRLATYASRCIDNELLMMLRSSKKQARDVYLYEPIGADKEGNEISLLDICMAPEVDVAEEMDLRENIRKLYIYAAQVLDEREKKILWLRYGLGGGKEQTQRELAEKMQISRSYVSRIEKKALRKLRECYQKEPEKTE